MIGKIKKIMLAKIKKCEIRKANRVGTNKLTFIIMSNSKPAPKPASSPKPNPNYPSKNPGQPSGPGRGNTPKK